MAKREAPKQITKKNARLISLGMLALSLAIAFVCVKGMLTPIRYDVKVGEASSATILATCEAVDEINTEIMREKARMETGSIYAIDSVKIGEYKRGAEDFFSGIDKLYGKAAANIPEDADIPASAAQWGETLSASAKAALCSSVSPAIDEASLLAVLSSTDDQLQTLKDITMSKLDTALEAGVSEEGNYTLGVTEGTILPALMLGLLILVVAVPSLFKFSEAGPGSLFAPFFAALGIALVVGALAQRSRLCMVGGIRDGMMFGDFKLLYGFVAIFAVVLAGNLITGHFKLGFSGQPVAHSDHLWNLLGMLLVGWGSVLLGGCPLRQLILAGEGNSDSTVTVFGMITGAAFAHNFGLAGVAASADAAGGVPTAGRIAVVIGIVFVLVISLLNMPKKADA